MNVLPEMISAPDKAALPEVEVGGRRHHIAGIELESPGHPKVRMDVPALTITTRREWEDVSLCWEGAFRYAPVRESVELDATLLGSNEFREVRHLTGALVQIRLLTAHREAGKWVPDIAIAGEGFISGLDIQYGEQTRGSFRFLFSGPLRFLNTSEETPPPCLPEGLLSIPPPR